MFFLVIPVKNLHIDLVEFVFGKMSSWQEKIKI